MKFKTKLVSVLAAVSMFAAFGVAANAEGATAGVAQIGNEQYSSLSDAVKAAEDNDTIRLLADLKDIGEIFIGKSITIDGDNKTISGASKLRIGPAAENVTLTEIKFDDIGGQVGNNKINVAVRSDLTGSLTISNCSFKDVESEPLQLTVVSDDANIVIENNTFAAYSEGETAPTRLVHIQTFERSASGAATGDTVPYDFSATVTGNKFVAVPKGHIIEIHQYADSSKINASGNYFVNYTSLKDNEDGKIYIVGLDANDSNLNDSYKIYPLYTDENMETSYAPAAAVSVQSYKWQAYDTLQAAIDNAPANTTIRLTKDVTETVTIPAGKTVTLDLNGYTLKNAKAGSEAAKASKHTITNNGTLTVIDSSEDKSGTVDNVSHGRAAFYNSSSGVAYLYGGKYDRSEEAGEYPDKANGNSWYYIVNDGTMTMQDIVVESTGGYSSLIENGLDNGSASLTINNGTYSGGVNVLKNDSGKVIINGGTFTNKDAYGTVLNWGNAEIKGGTFTNTGCEATIILGENKSNTSYIEGFSGIVTITDGTFTGETAVAPFGNSSYYGDADIYAGTFSSDVSDYLADGCAISAGDKNGFTVINPTDNEGTVDSGTYRSAVENGAYEQLWIFEMDENVTGEVTFNVTSDKDGQDSATLDYSTPTAESITNIGLIITGIPEGVTVDASVNSVQ